jgi:hypothetical protein
LFAQIMGKALDFLGQRHHNVECYCAAAKSEAQDK